GHQQLGSIPNSDFSLVTNNTRRLTLKNSGLVGINNTGPSYRQLDVGGSLNSTSFYLNGTQLNSTSAELNTLNGITAGTASASKALILDASRNITILIHLAQHH